MTNSPRFPIGKPVNRPPPEQKWLPIPGRPGWLRHRESGEEVYREPEKPPPWPFPQRPAKLFTTCYLPCG